MLKFRAWDGKTMLYDFAVIDGSCVRKGKTCNYPLMQSIGLKDCEGQDIYESDIIELSCGCCKYEVIWDQARLCWWPKDDGMSQQHLVDINVWEYVLTIVGNIYEADNVCL